MVFTVVPAAAPAEPRSEGEFVIKIRGFTVGRFRLQGERDGGAYLTTAQIDSVGVVRVFRRFSYRGTSRGVLQDGRLTPARYEEAIDTGRRQSEAVIDYAGGVPRLIRYTSPTVAAPDSPDPATQGGTLDPLSALFAVLGDRSVDALCATNILMFDGKRRTQLLLAAPQRVGATVTCAGEYRRLAGFTAKELSRHVAFRFELTYGPGENGLMQATRVAIDTFYGLATLDRR